MSVKIFRSLSAENINNKNTYLNNYENIKELFIFNENIKRVKDIDKIDKIINILNYKDFIKNILNISPENFDSLENKDKIECLNFKFLIGDEDVLNSLKGVKTRKSYLICAILSGNEKLIKSKFLKDELLKTDLEDIIDYLFNNNINEECMIYIMEKIYSTCTYRDLSFLSNVKISPLVKFNIKRFLILIFNKYNKGLGREMTMFYEHKKNILTFITNVLISIHENNIHRNDYLEFYKKLKNL